jgi:folylpolyglutamate synthase
MFTSPHLISANERLKINGKPISYSRFAHYFWTVYDKLKSQQETANDMPSYFRMLTVMAFHAFLEEQVDVAVVEVGVGGQYDCTNVLP